MNILLLGSGGREHALAWKLAQSPRCEKLFAAPGNPGIAQHAACVALDAADHAAVVLFCNAQEIGLVVVGPEAPLVDGLADSLRSAGIAVFGPSKAAAQLEGSKTFTKEMCERAGIPTAGYRRAETLAEAMAALDAFGVPVVVKADGLAAGKGVTVAMTPEIHRRDAIAGVDQVRGKEAVLGSQVTHPGCADDERSLACKVVGDLAFRSFEVARPSYPGIGRRHGIS